MNNDMVPVQLTEAVPALIPSDPFAPGRRVIMMIDPTDRSLLARSANAVVQGKPNWEEYVGRVLKLRGVTLFIRQISPAEEVDVRYGIYIALHGANGEDIITTSKGVLDSLPLIGAAYGPPPWPNGVDVVLVRIKTGKHVMVSLAPAIPVSREE